MEWVLFIRGEILGSPYRERRSLYVKAKWPASLEMPDFLIPIPSEKFDFIYSKDTPFYAALRSIVDSTEYVNLYYRYHYSDEIIIMWNHRYNVSLIKRNHDENIEIITVKRMDSKQWVRVQAKTELYPDKIEYESKRLAVLAAAAMLSHKLDLLQVWETLNYLANIRESDELREKKKIRKPILTRNFDALLELIR
ncbi:MAG: hypothetical protein F7C82_05790 [Desulfurococcales archaeon]|nr:hypothetical protein [Desulfurococcales archaeon]